MGFRFSGRRQPGKWTEDKLGTGSSTAPGRSEGWTQAQLYNSSRIQREAEYMSCSARGLGIELGNARLWDLADIPAGQVSQ